MDFHWPPSVSSSVPTYASFASFPSASVAGNGSLAIALDTNILYESNGTSWLAIGGPGAALSIGSPANGLSITSNVLSLGLSSASTIGALSSADWSTFNGKQPAGNYITALTGDGTASGPGSVALTLSTVNSNVGSFSPAAITVNAKGLITAASNATVGNISDAGTDGITVAGGTNAILGSGVTLSQHVADTTHNGYLSSTDWNTFNSKQSALTIGNLTAAGTDGITVTGGTGAVIGSGTSISQRVADTTHNGYLSSTDWNTFNGKVGGAANLNTVGAVPYQNAAGSISIDGPNFFWDSTHHRLGIGNSAPAFPLEVSVNSSVTGIQNTDTGSQGASGGAIISAASNPGGAMTSGSRLGQYKIQGTYDASSTYVTGVSIQAFATENWSSSANGAKLVFQNTANTTNTLQTVLTLDQDKSATFTGTVSGTQLTSTVSTGTAPITVSSTTQVANLNAATAGTTTNLAGGAGGSIPYQSAAGTTAMLANGSSGQALLSNGGTNAPSWGNVLTNPMTTLGDIIYENATPAPARLAGNTAATINFLAQTGTGSVSAAPAWTAFTAPTVQIFTSGSGTYTLPSSPRNPLYIRVRMVGGGGGGGGSSIGAGTAGTGSTGGTTTFGSSFLTANGGTGGAEPRTGSGGTGGTASIGAGAYGTAIQGGSGAAGGFNNSASAPALPSGAGASSPFGGGAGGLTGAVSTGIAGIANTGSGGGGAGTTQNNPSSSGHGGGAGGYIDAIILNPPSTYSYSIGTGGNGGSAGTSGAVGGQGGSGYIEVTEYYQ